MDRGRIVAPVFWVAFAATLVRYEVQGRFALRRGLREFEWSMARLQRSLVRCFEFFGLEVVVERDEAVDDHAPYLGVANHQSLLDIPLIGHALFTNLPKYVAKKELERGIPAISLNLRAGRHAIVDRADPRQAIGAIDGLARRSAEHGTSAVIFPEGTRARDGRLGRFRRAGSRALLRGAPDLPVVPIAISGSWRLNTIPPFPVGETVTLRVGPPLDRDEPDGRVLARAEAWIRDHVDDDPPEQDPDHVPDRVRDRSAHDVDDEVVPD